MKEENERRLFGRIRLGDRQALADAFAQHGDAVYSVALRITGSRVEAEDILHNIFAGLADALARAGDIENETAWIKTVAARRSLDALRVHNRRRETDLADYVIPQRSHDDSTLDAMALERAIAQLPPALRSVFVLKEIEGYSHAEIAGLTGIAENASEVRLYRAKKALRNMLRNDL